jgi:di/tricarboxylate transporter
METEILLVLLILLVTVILFVTEALRVDIIAVLIMLSLAWLGLITPVEAFSGFASNAVIAMAGVMILGYGIDRTGVMVRLSRTIIGVAGTKERRLRAVVSMVVGPISAFMQNIGAAALFLPAMMRISKTTNIPTSRLLMPMGFAAILGGTLSMVGSSNLIILNDLMIQNNLRPFDLFTVTPVGLPLLIAGIAYFFFFGRYVLPESKTDEEERERDDLAKIWHIPTEITTMRIPDESPLVGKTREEMRIQQDYHLHLLAIEESGDVLYAPWRYTRFVGGQELAFLGDPEDSARFAADLDLLIVSGERRITEAVSSDRAGFAELIIPSRSSVIDRSIREIALRKNFGVEPIILLSGPEEKRIYFSERPLTAGDTLVVHGSWERIRAIGASSEFVLLTTVEGEPIRESKAVTAVLCFIGALLLTFVGVPISLALLSGAVAMVLLGVISIGEAYRAVNWRTIVLIAGLIPLGIAMDQSGAAAFLADQLIGIMSGQHMFLIVLGIGLLATVFTLFMSNVAATVLLVPLVIIIGGDVGLDPRGLSLFVGICASNSFVLPTHQVNALLMAPGGYHNRDYIRAGGIMTVIFLVVASTLSYLLFL